jgi:hypothetical protein
MCGGVVGMTCSALPVAKRTAAGAHLPYALAYNGGRIASYGIAGAIAGMLGGAFASIGFVERAQLGLRLFAAVMMVAVGLYVAGFARGLRWMERIGEPLWRQLAPLARRLVPVDSLPKALALGLLWGWLPCGLVYAALAAAVTTGSPLGGAATMAAFGLGTLPMLMAMGVAASFIGSIARAQPVRVVAGLSIVGFGVLQMAHAGRAWAALRTVGAMPVCCASHSLW